MGNQPYQPVNDWFQVWELAMVWFGWLILKNLYAAYLYNVRVARKYVQKHGRYTGPIFTKRTK